MTRWILGLAAGRNAEGVDALLAEVQGRVTPGQAAAPLAARVAHWLFEAYPTDLRALLANLSSPAPAEARQIGVAHRALGEFLAHTGGLLADKASVSWQRILCAGCIPYAIWHDGDQRFASTFAVGAMAVLAERTGLTVVSEFAWRDLCCGGQGEPLSPLLDQMLFGDANEHRLLVHLGTMTHAVYLPAIGPQTLPAERAPLAAWVVGPGTLLLDGLVQHLTGGKEREDVGGKYAVQGRQIPELFERWTNHPFLRRRPPKSTHRSTFADEFARSTVAQARQHKWASYDLLCTANHLVAWSVADSARQWLPKGSRVDRLLLTGAGVRNGLLWRLLEEEFRGVPITRTDTLGYPAEPKEALDAALLAALTLDGMPANVPAATGATGRRLLGYLTPGSATNWMRCLQWMTGHDDEPGEEED